MAEVLSQNEVESLLSALDPANSSGKSAAQQSSVRTNVYSGQISVYDFKRPERVSKEQMRAFQALHEGFSREFGASLSAMLRSIIEVKLISVDQLTYSEFVFSLENPTCFNLLESKGLEGHMIIDLNPSIIFPIVDRLLGGGKTNHQSLPSRPLTEIELKLVGRITDRVIQALENAWRNIVLLQLSVTKIESNPQLVQIVPPNEVIVLISFEIMMAELRGIMNLCIPYNTIESLTGKLTSDSWSAYNKKGIDPAQRIELEAGLRTANVEMVIEVADSKISAGELASLNIGDVILTDRDQNKGVTVVIEGKPVFVARPGLLKGHKAVEIVDRIKGIKDKLLEEKTATP
jgi:flagellar motor switch protein FliM